MKFGLLKVTTADGRTREYPIDLPSLVVGRADGNSIVIEDLSVARRHARLIIDSGRLLVEDLGSAEGTFIAGQRIPANTPSLVETAQDIRFGDVTVRYQAPAGIQADQPAGDDGAAAPAAPVELSPTTRVTLSMPPQPVEAGATPAIAYVAVQNRGRVVDELSITVLDLPPEWVRISQPKLVLLPNEQAEVTLVIQPPRRSDSHAGTYDFSVVVTSGESGREVLAGGQLTVLPFDATTLRLHPVRSKKHFSLVAENQGNALATYRLGATDDEEAFLYQFDASTIDLPPGQELTTPFHVSLKKRKLLGPTTAQPFSVVATPANDPDGTKATVMGQLAIKPPLQKFVKPAILTLVAAAIAVAVFVYFFWPSSKSVQTANAEAAYAGVHMCDKGSDKQDKPSAAAAASAAPLFAQVDPQWATLEYAKAKDPEFGPDWCGTTIEQCGCAMTSVATVMALFQVLTMPDGTELNPKTINDWFNLNARKTTRGWVSQGYVYGDVVWTATNQLSGEIAKAHPGTRTIRFARIGTGAEEEVKSELKAGRPVILEVPGHWIAAVGLDGDKILINDPYYRDRKTLDVYKDKVKSSVLFEQSADLSAVVITAPSNVRLRVTDKQGRIVGTLNTGTPEQAKKEAQAGVPGSSYSSRAAWRDPTCVESPPPVGAGTNQIILPGAKEDYKIEVLDAGGGPTSFAIHSYDRNGVVAVQTEDNPGPAVLNVSYDPSQASALVSLVPGASPSPEAQPSPGAGAPAGGGGAAPKPSAATTPTKAATTPGTATPTVVPTPAPPANVTVTCKAPEYAAAPKNALITCNATIDGTFTSTNWTVNGIAVPSGAGKTIFTTSFDQDTSAAIQLTACNLTACRTGNNSVKVVFPAASATPTATPTPTGITPTATPAVPPATITLGCVVSGIAMSQTANCATSFLGDYNSIAWSAPGASPPDASAGSKTFALGMSVAPADGVEFTVTSGTLTTAAIPIAATAGTVQAALDARFGTGKVVLSGGPVASSTLTLTILVTETICNGSACVTPSPVAVQFTFGPLG